MPRCFQIEILVAVMTIIRFIFCFPAGFVTTKPLGSSFENTQLSFTNSRYVEHKCQNSYV